VDALPPMKLAYFQLICLIKYYHNIEYQEYHKKYFPPPIVVTDDNRQT